MFLGFPGGASGKELSYQCRRCTKETTGLNPVWENSHMLTLASRVQCVEDRLGVSLASPLLAPRPAGMFPQTGSDLSAPRRLSS